MRHLDFRAPSAGLAGNGSHGADLGDFGPAASSGFDFTPLFEDAILGIAPSALLLIALPLRILALQRRQRKVANGGLLSDNKRAFLAIFALMQLLLLLMTMLHSALRTKASIPAAALVFACAVGLCVLSHLEHARSVRPSMLINGYLLLTMPFDMARARTLFLLDASGALATLYTAMVGVKMLVLLAEAVEKRAILLEPYRGLSPEETSGLYSRSFFWWLNELITKGSSRLLSNADLYPIDGGMTAAKLRADLSHEWNVLGSPKGPAARPVLGRHVGQQMRSGSLCRPPSPAYRLQLCPAFPVEAHRDLCEQPF